MDKKYIVVWPKSYGRLFISTGCKAHSLNFVINSKALWDKWIEIRTVPKQNELARN